MCKDVNARFTTVPMKALSDQVCIRYHPHVHSISLFSVVVSLQKWQVHFSSYKNHIIFHIFDEIRISRVSLYTGHCYLCMRVAKNYAYSPLKESNKFQNTWSSICPCSLDEPGSNWIKLKKLAQFQFPILYAIIAFAMDTYYK